MVRARSRPAPASDVNGVGTKPVRRQRPVYYRERDGKPLAETQLHGEEIVRATQTLQLYFADRPDVYVWMNMFFYWEEGNPRASVAPDVFVALGVPKEPARRIYKVWEEGRPPTTVLEVTSSKTRHEDMGKKREIYATMGVAEYFLYDPLGDYLRPPLQGYRLEGRAYVAMTPDNAGALTSEALGLRLLLVDGRLRFFELGSGAMLLAPSEGLLLTSAARDQAEARAESEAARAESEAARAESEAAARRAAEARAAELEARLRRLEQGTGR